MQAASHRLSKFTSSKMSRRKSFAKEDRYVWEGWWRCFLCGKNTWSDLHHIIPQNDHNFQPGSFNGSIYNSAPLCRYPCHIGNDATLEGKQTEFLNRTKNYIDNTDYERKDKDETFLEVYSELYD